MALREKIFRMHSRVGLQSWSVVHDEQAVDWIPLAGAGC